MLRRGTLAFLAVTILLAGLPPAEAPAQNQDPNQSAPEIDAAGKKLLAAHGLFRRSLFKLAEQEYSEFLQKYPKHKDATTARYALSICQYRLGQFQEATKLIEEVLKDTAFKQRDEALAVLGHCYLSLKDNAKALEAFDTLLAMNPTSKHAEGVSLNRAQVLYLLNRKDESLKACQAFIQKYPQSTRAPAAHYFQALSQYDLGQFAASSTTLADLLQNFKDSAYELHATFLLGQCQTELGQYDDAAASFTKMLASAPAAQRAQGMYSLGVALYRGGKYAEASKQLSEVLAKYADDRYAAPARLQLGLTQLAADDPGKARTTLGEVVKNDPDRATTARYWIAQCDMRQKKFKAARQALDELYALNPPAENIDQITFDRAVCRMAMDEYAEAAGEFAAFRQKYTASGSLGEATYRQAFCLHKTDKYDQSLALCEAALKLPKEQAGPAVVRPTQELAAENLFLLGKHAQAAAAFAKLAQSAADDDDKRRLVYRQGQCASFLGDYANAIALLKPFASDAAVEKDQSLHDAIFVLGDAYLQTQQFSDAAKALSKYVSLTTRNGEEARFKLGLAQLRGGEEDAAKKTLAQLIGGSVQSPWVQRALFEYGQLSYNQKQPAEAQAALSKVVAAKAPEALMAPATYLLGWIDFDAGKYKDAAGRFSQVTAQFAKHELAPDAAYQEALSLKLDGQTEPALAKLQAYLSANADGKHAAEARYHAGACLAKLDRHDEAIKLFTPLAADQKTRTDALLYDLAWSQRATRANDAAEQTYRQLLAEFKQSTLLTAVRAELAELVYLKDSEDAFKEAAGLLEQVLADDQADAKTHAVARYRLAWCYVKLDAPDKAAPLFSTFAEDNLKDELAPSALYQAGVASTNLQKLPEAQKFFAALLKRYPEHELAAVTYLKLGEVQNELSQFEPAGQTFSQFLAKFPKDKFVYLAQFGMGWSLENRKMYDEARKWYGQVIDNHNGPTAARAQFQLGECNFAESKFDDAVKELLKVDIVYAYPEWGSKALYEAGRAFEQLKDIDQAKAQYTECVKKYKDEGAAELAQKRLAALQ